MSSTDLASGVLVDDNVVVGDVVVEPVTSLVESGVVGDQEPSAREDSTTLKLVHLLRCIPVRGQSAN